MASISKYQNKSGKTMWRYQVFAGIDHVTGKRRNISRKGFKTKNEAELSMSKLLVSIDQHGFAEKNDLTYLKVYEYFIKSYRNTVKESTLNRVLGLFKYHVLPALGNYPIKDITTPICQEIVNKWSNNLKDFRKVKNYAGLVFKEAKRLKIIYDNPMDLVILPKPVKKIGSEKFENFWDRNELKKFFECLDEEYSSKNYKAIALFRLLAFTGMRKGEALALQWSDLNFLQKTLSINKTVTRAIDNKMVVGTPKTEHSIRVLDLDAKTLTVLKRWKQVQRKELLILGYNSDSQNQLVFTNYYNRLLSTTKPNKWLDHIIKKYDLKHIGVHGFRHTFASIAFESGATIKQVQVQLGHADVQTTLNVYSHVSKYAKKQTINKYAGYLGF
ncbi:MAG: site-specific integrase [Liquorilactobacillus nagelii]|jgi:integrase|uniref:tyrosine-type recombinase/integrase n=1 Tax=Liquorilactobacillus nagelii TaxID=82688 RepID=UPI00242E43F7|nr:tyrosine-type recombinase/integrase [Liquorilactobacillus nagelii]MCI1921769.1 site-specific integrase [Liquorilactobacillus nagelii]MCI1976719.1 site-specific integrase [Liquorilactobacillus nagelii]